MFPNAKNTGTIELTGSRSILLSNTKQAALVGGFTKPSTSHKHTLFVPQILIVNIIRQVVNLSNEPGWFHNLTHFPLESFIH